MHPSTISIVNIFSLCTLYIQKLRGFYKHFLWILLEANLFTLIIHKTSVGFCEVPQKIWAGSVQPFGRLLDTNKQTPNRKARFIDIYLKNLPLKIDFAEKFDLFRFYC